MLGLWVRLVAVIAVGMSVACGSTESNGPQPASAGGGGMASGGAGGGGGGTVKVHVCQSGAGDGTSNPREVRIQYLGANGSLEDHCYDWGQLVQYGCASALICTPTPENPCAGDLGVPYSTGQVSESTVDCACADGVCPAL